MAVIDVIFAKVKFKKSKKKIQFPRNTIQFCRPDEEMLESLYQLLEFADRKADPMLVLTPTAVVHTFCRLHSDCGEKEKVQRFVDRLEKSIQKSLESNLLKRSIREKVSLTANPLKLHMCIRILQLLAIICFFF